MVGSLVVALDGGVFVGGGVALSPVSASSGSLFVRRLGGAASPWIAASISLIACVIAGSKHLPRNGGLPGSANGASWMPRLVEPQRWPDVPVSSTCVLVLLRADVHAANKELVFRDCPSSLLVVPSLGGCGLESCASHVHEAYMPSIILGWVPFSCACFHVGVLHLMRCC